MTGRSSRPTSLDWRLRRVADRVGFALLWGWILVSLFFVPTWLGVWWVGAIALLVGLFVCWQAAEASTHPVYVIGTRRGVTTEPITEPGHDCDECGAPAGGGVRRRYTKRKILFGTTVAVPEWGENVYCRTCLDGLEFDDDSDPSSSDGRLTDDANLHAERP